MSELQSIRIAIIEDEPAYAKLLCRWLSEAEGVRFEADVAHTMRDALDLLRKGGHYAILADLNLPDSCGPETIRRLREAAPNVPILAISGMDDLANMHEARRAGAGEYLVKGLFSVETLERAVRYAIERQTVRMQLLDARQRYLDLTDSLPEVVCEVAPDGRLIYANRNAAAKFLYGESDFTNGLTLPDLVVPEDRDRVRTNKELILGGRPSDGNAYTALRRDGTTFPVMIYSRRVIRAGRPVGLMCIVVDVGERRQLEMELQLGAARLRRTLEETVNVLASAYEMRDPYTNGHQRRTARLACAIAAELGYDEDAIEGLRVAGLLHDIGKIAIPAEILTKPAFLTPIEFDLIKTHPTVGHDIVKAVSFPWPVARIILEHHERLDGSGYPGGLKGDALLDISRVLAVADVVEAMMSDRPYRPAIGLNATVEELTRNRGILYDARAVDACLALVRDRGYSLHEGEPVAAPSER